MATKIRGLQDGENGHNDNYMIQGRGIVNREQLVQEIEEGKHPHHNVIVVDGERYARSNPDSTTQNNINRE